MTSLFQFLKTKEYKRTKFTVTKTNHLLIEATINGIAALLILDTGASSSCLGFESIQKFSLKVKESEVLATGAGASNLKTQISPKNQLCVGKWSRENYTLVLFDLQHVNQALCEYNVPNVDGILGADILKRGKAVIDYDRNYLYLRG